MVKNLHIYIFFLATLQFLSAKGHLSNFKESQLTCDLITAYNESIILHNGSEVEKKNRSNENDVREPNWNKKIKLIDLNLTDISECGNATNQTHLRPTFFHGLTCLKLECPTCDEYDRWLFIRLWKIFRPIADISSYILFIFLFVPLSIGFVFKELFMGVCRQKRDLKGKVALVTGGSRGLGFEVAKELAACGARVIITSRQIKRGAEAAERIRKITGNRFVNNEVLNLDNYQSVRKLAVDFKRDNKVLDILVNNAGNFDSYKTLTHIRKCPFVYSTFLGHFLLTNLLVTALKVSEYPVVVNVTCSYQMFGSLARTKGCGFQGLQYQTHTTRSMEYQQSKLACTMFSEQIANRCPRINSFSANPGLLRTESSCPTNIRSVLRLTRRKYSFLPCALIIEYLILCFWGKSAKQGAQTVLTCIMEDKLENGAYFSNCRKVSNTYGTIRCLFFLVLPVLPFTLSHAHAISLSEPRLQVCSQTYLLRN